jgi:hypothetical protein
MVGPSEVQMLRLTARRADPEPDPFKNRAPVWHHG